MFIMFTAILLLTPITPIVFHEEKMFTSVNRKHTNGSNLLLEVHYSLTRNKT
jgi:hypothetical protein